MKFNVINLLLLGWVVCLCVGCSFSHKMSLQDAGVDTQGMQDMQGMWVIESSVTDGKYALFDEESGKLIIFENQCIFWIKDWGVDKTLEK